MEVLIFALENLLYALPASSVREVLRAVAVTPVPRMPPPLVGVIDVRGEAVVVVDTRAAFGLCSRPVEPLDRFVLASVGSHSVALHVDRVVDLVALGPGHCHAPIGRSDEGLVIVGNVMALLGEDAVAAVAAFSEDGLTSANS